MTTRTFYRLCIWLPVVLPGVVAIFVHGLGWPVPESARKPVQILLLSWIYGGVPYAVLAAWATWRLSGRSELEIRRLMLLAPLAMAAFYLPFLVIVGIIVGAPLRQFFLVGVIGALASIPLGFGYVGLVLLLRKMLGTRLRETDPPQPVDAHDGATRSASAL